MEVNEIEKKPKSFPIVGIGASAGGLEAFTQLLKALPIDTGMVFVLVQHLDPTHESILPEILARTTKMSVQQAKENMKIEPNGIYVIPPNVDMTLIDGILKLTPRSQSSSPHMSIDRFFRSLATDNQHNVIGIVLSGTGSDGTLGLKAMKAEGGITMAQDKTAKYQAMPLSAIASDCVDFILSPIEIARELEKISRHPFMHLAQRKELDEIVPEAEGGLNMILSILQRAKNVDFNHYKKATINRRIMRRMLMHKLTDLSGYAKYLKDNPLEVDALFQDLLINVTSFFRDPSTFQYVADTILPRLMKQRDTKDPVRIWVAGCSTGEEVYSLAICLLEFLGDTLPRTPIQIFGTDLNEVAVKKARSALYPKAELQEMTPKRLERFFVKIDGSYQVSKAVREMCVFAPHNLLKDPPFSQIDLIACCNVLIYFDTVVQKKALQTFHYALKPGGYLMLGKSETVSTSLDFFSQVDKKYKLYTKKDTILKRPINFDLQIPERGNTDTIDGMPKIHTRENNTEGFDIQKETDKFLLSRFTPASVVINNDLDILQFRGSTGMYLENSPGRASLNLLKMAKAGLGFELRSTVSKAKKSGRIVRKEGLRVNHNGKVKNVAIEAIPLKILEDESYFLVLFEEMKPQASTNLETTVSKSQMGTEAKNRRIVQLEQELESVREDMRSVTEEQDATNEELQSSNEEVLSSNEELQSVNEELETSQEELQSSNEELTTINQELQNRNEQLSEAREYSEAIVRTVREPLLILDRDLRIKTANKSFYLTFKTNEHETEGSYLYDLGNGEWNIPRLRTLMIEILPKNNDIDDYEIEHIFPSIGKKIMLLNARKLVQGVNKTELILLSIEDVTNRREIEGSLRESEERLRFMAESMPQKIFTATPKGDVDYFNPRWMEFTGLTFDEIKNWSWTQIIHPDDVQENIKRWKHSIETGELFEFEHRFKRHDGVYRWHLTRARSMRDEKGKIIMWIGSNTDIHDQKSALEQREEFIGIASHELKTPVTSVKAYTQILQSRFRKADDMKSVEMVGKMDAQLDKLTSLIGDLLDVTKIEGGKLQFHQAFFDFNELASEIIEEMQRTTDKHSLIKEFSKAKTVYGDRDRIGQVITNLISNAIKYSPHSEKIILKSSTDANNVTLSVQDFGVGMSKEDQAKVFDRFYRIAGIKQDTYPGLGLGLYISAEIIKRQGGEIWVESKKGKGSTFFFTLPLKRKQTKQENIMLEKKYG
ncbi:MAG: PAS domain S-box protein [Candidatus Levybacteria bacterium]|nr:PAS domain S-box protein [Candidatus Levybacteria bacterium]